MSNGEMIVLQAPDPLPFTRTATDPFILVIDRDPKVFKHIKASLSGRLANLIGATDHSSGVAQVKALQPGLIFLDPTVPGTAGRDWLAEIHDLDAPAQVIIHTSHYSTQSAVLAMQSGAYDYLNKPAAAATLQDRVDHWLQEHCDRQTLASSEPLVGRSPVMTQVLANLHAIAPLDSAVLITGDTGTGKELLARSLYTLSGRRGPFVLFDCLPVCQALESGISEADHGVLFLDHVSELPLPLQARLVRLLENRALDVRIVAASECDLRPLISRGRFRADLYYRLAQARLHLPRLCDRKEDLPLLSEHFLNIHSLRFKKRRQKLSNRAQVLIERHPWPGNVRELENAINSACMSSSKDLVDLADSPDAALQCAPVDSKPEIQTMARVQYNYAVRILGQCKGDCSKAADILGIGRATLYRLLARG